MADQGLWFKLWCSAVDDPALSNLSLEDFGRWAKLGAYVKRHGSDGAVTLLAPAPILCAMFDVAGFDALMCAFERLPNVTVWRAEPPVSLVTTAVVSFVNWQKYQGDYSTPRVRKYRANETAKRRRDESRRDEKRGEGGRTTHAPAPPPGKLTPADIAAKYGQAPAYYGLDVQAAAERCLNWCVVNRKPFTEKRAVNWLNGDALKRSGQQAGQTNGTGPILGATRQTANNPGVVQRALARIRDGEEN